MKTNEKSKRKGLCYSMRVPGHSHVVEAQPCRRNKNQIRFANFLQRNVRSNPNSAVAIHRPTIRRRRGNSTWSELRSDEDVP